MMQSEMQPEMQPEQTAKPSDLMVGSNKKWTLRPQLNAKERVAQFRDLDPVLAQVLHNRGLADYNAARDFIGGQIVLHEPTKMKGMHKAIERINKAIRERQPIVIYGDFDADGVTSTVLLVQTLEALGANVRPYIPHRVDEGYGLNTPALLQLAAEGVKLVVTVDCGVRSVEEVSEANAVGLDIIITDHHSIGDELPPALVVLNPKQIDCKYPEDMLAGVGIAFKLADQLLRVAKANRRNAPTLTTDDLLDLVALGTVADLAPLDRMENRSLVLHGLQQINRAKRPGIHALLEVVGIEPGKVNSTSIGFGLGPRINAAGRLESAMLAYDLLYTQDYEEARVLAQKLQEINLSRQDLTQKTQEEARTLADLESREDLPLIFAASPTFQSGIVGLVAGRLAEEFYRPVIVVEEGAEESRGSCRSIPEFNITAALDECADLLLRHGGHAQAAGFSIRTGNIPDFRERMLAIASRELGGQTLIPSLNVDVVMSLSQVTLALAREIEKLEPLGHANSAPLFMSQRLKVIDPRPVGREGKHLKLKFSDGPLHMDGIAFGLGHWISRMPQYVDIVYYLEVNEWNGFVKPQANVQDIRPAGG